MEIWATIHPHSKIIWNNDDASPSQKANKSSTVGELELRTLTRLLRNVMSKWDKKMGHFPDPKSEAKGRGCLWGASHSPDTWSVVFVWPPTSTFLPVWVPMKPYKKWWIFPPFNFSQPFGGTQTGRSRPGIKKSVSELVLYIDLCPAGRLVSSSSGSRVFSPPGNNNGGPPQRGQFKTQLWHRKFSAPEKTAFCGRKTKDSCGCEEPTYVVFFGY